MVARRVGEIAGAGRFLEDRVAGRKRPAASTRATAPGPRGRPASASRMKGLGIVSLLWNAQMVSLASGKSRINLWRGSDKMASTEDRARQLIADNLEVDEQPGAPRRTPSLPALH